MPPVCAYLAEVMWNIKRKLNEEPRITNTRASSTTKSCPLLKALEFFYRFSISLHYSLMIPNGNFFNSFLVSA
jgi:hypothetical protein